MRMRFGLLGIAASMLLPVAPLQSQETSIGYRVFVPGRDLGLDLQVRTAVPCNQVIMLPVRPDSVVGPGSRPDSVVPGSRPDSARARSRADSVVIRDERCGMDGTRKEWRDAQPHERFAGAANIYKDAADNGLLNVNFWLPDCQDVRETDRAECVAVSGREYGIQFRNRESRVFRSRGGQVKALTLPLKVRLGYTEGEDDVRSRGEAGVNGNVFFGYRFGREKYFYERGAGRNPYTQFHITPGVFLGASVVNVEKETSITAETPVAEKIPIGALSGGVGTLIGWRNFNLGLFVGWDNGLGSTARKWDFNRKPYVTIGITIDSFLEAARL